MEGGLAGPIGHEVFLGFLVGWGCIIHFDFTLLTRARFRFAGGAFLSNWLNLLDGVLPV